MPKTLTGWTDGAGTVCVIVKESPEFREGLRVVHLDIGEMGDALYHDMDELIEGESLRPPLEQIEFGPVEDKSDKERKYLDAKGHVCPKCGSREISTMGPLCEGYGLTSQQKVFCEAEGCDAKWWDTHKLIGMEMINE